jgi:hypothetical protein
MYRFEGGADPNILRRTQFRELMIESTVKCCASVTIIGINHTVTDVPTSVCRYWQKAKVQGHGVFV